MKILVINSCGKAKKGSFRGQATLPDLRTAAQRNNYIQNYQDRAIAARNLYTGQQAVKVAKAVDQLRKLGHEVDYYIISAGFGLLAEFDKIPPYEVTFSGMRKQDLQERATSLGIPRAIDNLKGGYDFVYLALGKDYLKTFDLGSLHNKANRIVHFDRSYSFINPPYFRVNDSKIIGKDDQIPHFREPIGNLVQSKGSILLNYALTLREDSIRFPEWWSNIINSISNRNSAIDKHLDDVSTSLSFDRDTFKYTTSEIDGIQGSTPKQGSITGYDLMAASDEAQSMAKRIVNELSDNEIKEIYKAHIKLNPRDSKREDRREWVEKYRDREAILRKWSAWFDEAIETIQDATSDNKTDVRGELASNIREREENLGETSYLINPVRIALMSTFVDYLDNPKKLDESPAYKPRSESRSTSSESSKILDDSNFAVTISTAEDSVLIGQIENRNDFPLQSLKVTLEKPDGSDLSIAKALGENFSAAAGSVHIPFVRASMDTNPLTIDFKLEINGFYNFESGYIIVVEAEDPAIKREVSRKFQFNV